MCDLCFVGRVIGGGGTAFNFDLLANCLKIFFWTNIHRFEAVEPPFWEKSGAKSEFRAFLVISVRNLSVVS